MDLLVNGPAVARSSRGVKRYLDGVMRHLGWLGTVDFVKPTRWGMFERPHELLRRGRRDAILWTPCQRGPLFAHHHAVTVHDCINVEFIYSHDWRLPAYRRLFNAVLDGAESVVAISNATKAAILRNYRIDDAKIVVIPSGCDAFEIQSTTGRASASDEPYVLIVTNALPHKNAIAACEAFARSRAVALKLTLRVVGALPAQALEACRRAGVRLQLYDTVDDAQLYALYSGCLFLLSASLAEGHNLPVAEALASGANVLCSDIPAHREFYEGQVQFFDPCRREAITAAVNVAIDRPGRWFASSTPLGCRSFADVANDYRTLFLDMQARQ